MTQPSLEKARKILSSIEGEKMKKWGQTTVF